MLTLALASKFDRDSFVDWPKGDLHEEAKLRMYGRRMMAILAPTPRPIDDPEALRARVNAALEGPAIESEIHPALAPDVMERGVSWLILAGGASAIAFARRKREVEVESALVVSPRILAGAWLVMIIIFLLIAKKSQLAF